jgi:hypothetical protein
MMRTILQTIHHISKQYGTEVAYSLPQDKWDRVGKCCLVIGHLLQICTNRAAVYCLSRAKRNVTFISSRPNVGLCLIHPTQLVKGLYPSVVKFCHLSISHGSIGVVH